MGPVPLEAWLLAGVLYVALVALARAVAPARSSLGFARTVPDAAIAGDAVIDIASIAEGRVPRTATAIPAPGS